MEGGFQADEEKFLGKGEARRLFDRRVKMVKAIVVLLLLFPCLGFIQTPSESPQKKAPVVPGSPKQKTGPPKKKEFCEKGDRRSDSPWHPLPQPLLPASGPWKKKLAHLRLLVASTRRKTPTSVT
jgi:hypothetical protein